MFEVLWLISRPDTSVQRYYDGVFFTPRHQSHLPVGSREYLKPSSLFCVVLFSKIAINIFERYCITEALITHMCMEISLLMLQDLIRNSGGIYLNCTAIKNHWDMASSQYLSHTYNISCLSVPKKESFCQRDIAFLKLDLPSHDKNSHHLWLWKCPNCSFQKELEDHPNISVSAVSAYAALSLSSICWQVGPDPMISVARQGPGSGSNLAKYLCPWGLFKCRLKAIAWCDINH